MNGELRWRCGCLFTFIGTTRGHLCDSTAFLYNKLSGCSDSATCEPLSIAAEMQNSHIFPYPTGLPQQNSGSQQDTTIRVGFGMQVAKTSTYPVTCRFPVFVARYVSAITIHQRYRQTPGRHALTAYRIARCDALKRVRPTIDQF